MQRSTSFFFFCFFSVTCAAATAPIANTTPAQPNNSTPAATSPALAYHQPTTTAPTVSTTTPKPVSNTQAKLPVANTPGTKDMLQNDKDKISYAIGIDMGINLKAQNIDVNPEMLARGLRDGLGGGQTVLTQQEIATILANLQKQIITKRESDFKMQAEQNKNTGNTFLQNNKTKPGVVTLASGLQYKIITPGNGAKPAEKDTVTVNYVGSLLNGQEFDSSYRRGKPVTFPLAEMIPGWSEALRLMKAGSTWEVYVPANLAYGERGLPGGPIGPNQVLIFKINLVSIGKK